METSENAEVERTETTEVCSKCKKPLDTDGTPKWCKACRAEYQRTYNATKEGRAEAKGFAKGVSAMRKIFVDNWFELGSSKFNGYEIAHVAQNCVAPKFEPDLNANGNG